MIYVGNDSYIDTSLVTCSEYQLFLDQQRSEGHLHQPDHWNKDSFPSSQGRSPVLGVRPSDALAFCAWLTKHDLGIWQYRLPTVNEQKLLEADKSILLFSEMEVGYWVGEGKKFAWISNISPPIGPIITMMQKIFNRKSMIIDSSDLNKVISHALPLRIESTWIRFSALELNDILNPMLSHAHILEDARFYNHATARRLANDIFQTREHIRDYILILEREFTAILARTPDHTLDLAMKYICEIVKVLNRTRKIELEGHEHLTNAYECCLELTVTLALLDARIKGNMHAREGILIARQRLARQR